MENAKITYPDWTMSEKITFVILVILIATVRIWGHADEFLYLVPLCVIWAIAILAGISCGYFKNSLGHATRSKEMWKYWSVISVAFLLFGSVCIGPNSDTGARCINSLGHDCTMMTYSTWRYPNSNRVFRGYFAWPGQRFDILPPITYEPHFIVPIKTLDKEVRVKLEMIIVYDSYTSTEELKKQYSDGPEKTRAKVEMRLKEVCENAYLKVQWLSKPMLVWPLNTAFVGGESPVDIAQFESLVRKGIMARDFMPGLIVSELVFNKPTENLGNY